MASGRLGRCIIPARTGVELYVNSSGKEASVTIQTQVISTTANVEQTVVVGVAATTISQSTTVSSSPVGTYTSLAGLVYSCWPVDTSTSESVGYSTFSGGLRPPTTRSNAGALYEGSYEEGGNSHFKFIDPNSGNQTSAVHAGCLCGACVDTSGNNYRCCYRGAYGGNEIQNPLIWLMQENPDDHPGGKYGYPRSCSCNNWLWGDMIVGWSPGNKYVFCCPYNSPCNQGNGDYIYRAPQFIGCADVGGQKGVGIFKTDIAITAMQHYTNPCCCCGYTAANTWPVARFDASGCSANACCCGGPPCNYAFCKFHHYNCCGPSQYCCSIFLGFNWYALCNSSYCCHRCTSGLQVNWADRCCTRDGSNTTPFGNQGVNSSDTSLNCCFQCHKCGTIINDMTLRMSWCGNCWCCCNGADSYIWPGYWRTCIYDCSPSCGLMCYLANSYEMQCCCCTPSCWHATMKCKYVCLCICFNVRSYRARAKGTDYNRIKSPYGFDHGITNCYWAHHMCTDNNGTEKYLVGWPHPCVAGGKCTDRCSCYQYWAKNMYLNICTPEDTLQPGSEFPIKYLAWNPFDNYVYMGVRSKLDDSCGIFRIDPHKQRLFHGPICGCSSYPGCAENTCTSSLCRSETLRLDHLSLAACMNTHLLEYCKVADWPACWSQSKYKTNGFCVSCLFRNQRCNWLMDVYNHTSGKWDSYSTSNLHDWNLVQNSEGTDAFSLKINNTLTIASTQDKSCIVTTCNCFMSNIDCSGLIDWCFSANQYERNGIVLSNGDRVMINNNSDEKLNAQIWGYEG